MTSDLVKRLRGKSGLPPEWEARRLIVAAKGGIDWAGIDERILVPNLTEVFEKSREAADRIEALERALIGISTMDTSGKDHDSPPGFEACQRFYAQRMQTFARAALGEKP